MEIAVLCLFTISELAAIIALFIQNGMADTYRPQIRRSIIRIMVSGGLATFAAFKFFGAVLGIVYTGVLAVALLLGLIMYITYG